VVVVVIVALVEEQAVYILAEVAAMVKVEVMVAAVAVVAVMEKQTVYI
jgi:hypothetical protein